jgi:3-oxo-5alpha-steroid 4-dehydrogenase
MEKTEKSGDALSRRGFLKGSVLAGIGVAGAGLLTACGPKSSGDGQAGRVGGALAAADVVWDKEADVVIVGFGGAGAAAAIEAAGAGASVIIIEGTSTGGGASAINGGFVYLGGTALQKELGVEDSVEELFKYMKAAAGGTANEEALRLLADSSPGLYDWFIEMGVVFDKVLDPHHTMGGYPGVGLTYCGNEHSREIQKVAKKAPRGHVPSPEGNGMGYFRPLKAKVEERGCEIIYNTLAEHLVIDKNGRVVGVQADGSDSKKLFVKARRGVILTAGGYTNDTEMVRSHWIYDSLPGFYNGPPSEIGTGIKMGIEAGAETYGLSHHQIGTQTYGRSPNMPKGLLVNQAGRRFIAEDNYGSFVGEKIMQAEKSYLVMDDALYQVTTFDPGYAGSAPEVAHLGSADTPEELAKLVDIPGSSLANTVAYYNACVEQGQDDEFGKTEEYLTTLTTPPYHLFSFGPDGTYFSTSGGLKINLNTQVINREEKVIEGLYSAGRNSNIAFGFYWGSGSSMQDTYIFGRIAGQNAAAAAPIAEEAEA